ncbi:MAG: hypothetical protein Q7I99_00325 [Acholeplasmataceae bacterium]|nr:hypothetical protein [Acholeplasmataceae bacterium]
MKKKELIQLIKTKSEEVEIKDFSKSILERVKQLPRHEAIEAPRRAFKLKPALFVTLGTLASVLLFMVFYNPASPIIPTDPITPTLENMDQVIALSTVSTASLIELSDSQLSIQENYILQFGNSQTNQKISDEIKDVSRYLETIEKLFASQSDFAIEKESISNGGFANRMCFKTRDLLNQEASYKFDYNEIPLANSNRFTLEGELEIGQKTYLISGTADKDTNHLTLKAEKDISNYILINYEPIGQIHQFIIETVKDGEVIQSVRFQLEQSENQKQIKLEFIDGESVGSYEFQIEENDNVRMIKAKYNILIDDNVEKGEFMVRIINVLNQSTYSILIKPEGKPPFIITHGRMLTEARPKFQTTLNYVNL